MLRSTVQLRVTVKTGGQCRFAYSVDGKSFLPLGDVFVAKPGHWVGAKVGVFSTTPAVTAGTGYAEFDWFRVTGLQ